MKLRKLIAILLTVGYITSIVVTAALGSLTASNIAIVDVSVSLAWISAMIGLVKKGGSDEQI